MNFGKSCLRGTAGYAEARLNMIGNSFTSRKIDQLKPYDIEALKEEEGENSVVIIDVREEWEYNGDMGHVKGSVHMPMEQIPDQIEYLRKFSDRKIALICNSGQRSYFAAGFLKDNGIENVCNIYGGIIQWHLSGLDVEYD